jgi:flagellar biosynthesis protein FlhG
MRVVSVASGKGGVGKTCISVNMAIALAKQGKRVVLFDADLQLANIDVMIGLNSEFNLQHVINGEMSLREVMVNGPSGVQIITGGSGVAQLMHAGPKRMATFFSQIDALAEDFDILIYDTAAGLDNRVFAFLLRSDETLVISTAEPTSITDAYALIKVLSKRNPDAVMRVLINRVTNEHEARSVFDVLKTTAQNYLDVDLLYGGYVRQDSAFVESMKKRQAMLTAYPTCRAATDLENAAREFAIPVLPRHRAA